MTLECNCGMPYHTYFFLVDTNKCYYCKLERGQSILSNLFYLQTLKGLCLVVVWLANYVGAAVCLIEVKELCRIVFWSANFEGDLSD